ncbi:MAG TPA: hypothetical protein VJG49_02430 [Candidatus Nanoarchaeia archaeon]|nr:hypothetical protein [Candidatus Nanoarchaeia archaeon]
MPTTNPTIDDCFHLELPRTASGQGSRRCGLKQMLASVAGLSYSNTDCVGCYMLEGAYVYNPELARNCPLYTTDHNRGREDFTALMEHHPTKK